MKQLPNHIGLSAMVIGAGLLPLTSHAGDWWIMGGPALRGGMDVKITGSSYAQMQGLNTDAGVGIGNANAYGDRTYDNGYVRGDSSLGGGIVPNTTWNWGYNNAGQYNAGAGTLAYQKSGIPRYSSLANGGGGLDNSMTGGGFQIMAGVPLKESGRWTVDLVFGFQGIWSDAKLHENAGYVNINDTYDVSAIPSGSFPGAGHHGTYGGPFDPAATPPYTIIPNQPASRTATPAAPALAGAQSGINFEINQGFYQLNLGPQVGWKISKKLKLDVRPTVSMNIVDANVDRSETFMLGDGSGAQTWKDSADKCDVLFGLGINGGIDWQLGKSWFIGVTGGYDWVMNKLNVQVGPNNVALDASGWTVGLNFGKNF